METRHAGVRASVSIVVVGSHSTPNDHANSHRNTEVR
jgi:hypothetical protein